MESMPASRHMAALADPSATSPSQLEELRHAAAVCGVELSIYLARDPQEVAAAVDTAQVAGATALNLLASPILNASRKIVLDQSAALHLPAICQWPETAEEVASSPTARANRVRAGCQPQGTRHHGAALDPRPRR